MMMMKDMTVISSSIYECAFSLLQFDANTTTDDDTVVSSKKRSVLPVKPTTSVSPEL